MKSVLILTVLLSTLVLFASGINRCAVSPKWRLSNMTFPNDFPGQVKVIFFLKASCGFCRQQADRLGILRDELASNHSMANISYVIVNSHEKTSINRMNVFKEVTTIPVVQDVSKMNVWKMFQADTDDMLLFDKCNRLVLHLKLPDSMIHLGGVKTAITSAYTGHSCGKECTTKPPITRRTHRTTKRVSSTTKTTTATTTPATTTKPKA